MCLLAAFWSGRQKRITGTTVIPVMEEVVVMEKRLRLREEIHITTVREQARYQEPLPLQRENVSITRELAPGGPTAHEQTQPA